MVRIKERYLLVNIIYPPEPATKHKSAVPSFVVQHQPTVENLTTQLLLKAIRNEIAQLFGDHGSGALGGSLSGTLYLCAAHMFDNANHAISQVLVPSDINHHSQMPQRALPNALGGAYSYGSRPS